nr:hypothetical protein [Tanacetum cinerariifolium]
MKYQPVTAGNQSNPSAGFQEKFNAEKAREEIDQQYVLFPVWSSSSTNPQNNDGDAAFNGKELDFDAKKPESEVNVSLSSSAQSRKQDDKTKKEAKGKSPADFNNLETSITVSPIPTSRVHKDHPVTQIIGDLSLTTQTKSVTKVVKDQGGLSQMFNDDFHTCMFAYFLSQEEPNRVHQALKDPSWIEAMQKELLQFKMQEVWILVDFSYGKRAIGTKWVFRNKKDERGIVVYQLDVKSAFLYETTEEEVYVCQPLGFEDPDHLDKVYKVVKALYGLHLLELGKSASTPIDTEKPLLKVPDSEDVDVHTYMSMIGSFKSASTPIDTKKPLLKDPDSED